MRRLCLTSHRWRHVGPRSQEPWSRSLLSTLGLQVRHRSRLKSWPGMLILPEPGVAEAWPLASLYCVPDLRVHDILSSASPKTPHVSSLSSAPGTVSSSDGKMVSPSPSLSPFLCQRLATCMESSPGHCAVFTVGHCKVGHVLRPTNERESPYCLRTQIWLARKLFSR